MSRARSEDSPAYGVGRPGTPIVIDRAAIDRHEEDVCIVRALQILSKRLAVTGEAMTSPAMVKNYCQLRLGGHDREVFAVLYLDAQHRLLAFVEEFRGTLTQTSVYPREIVRAALAHNAAAVVLTHNHPSGMTEPSRADEYLTQQLKAALALVDVRVLDHMVVSASGCTSFAERGLL